MADILNNGGSTQDAEQVNQALIYGTAERLKQIGQMAWQTAKKVDEWARQKLESSVEAGNKLLLPETTTEKDLDVVETALKDPQNTIVEVNAIATTPEGNEIRQTVADPWDSDITQIDSIVSQAMDRLESVDQLTEPAEVVEAVVDNPEVAKSDIDHSPIVNEFIENAGESIKQGVSSFIAQANAYLQENVQVEYKPIPQQDGSFALAVDKPSLITQMSLAGGDMAAAAQEEMKRLAPQKFERVSEVIKNTQEKVKGAISQVSGTVLERLNDPSLGRHIDDLESRIGGELSDIKFEINELRSSQYNINDINGEVVQEFKAETSALRSQVGNLEGQISTMNQQQAKLETMLAALRAPKPQLNNTRLNQWQSNFVAKAKERFQQAKQYIGIKIDQVKAKVGELVEGFKQKAVERLQPIVDRLQPVVNQAQNIRADVIDSVTQARQSVGEKVDNAKRFVGEKAMDWQATAIAATASYVLVHQGKQNSQGTTVYQGENFDFHRNKDNSLLIVDKATQQPIYKDGELNKNAPQATKDKLLEAAQTTKQGLDQQPAHAQAKAQGQTQQQKPKVPAAARR